MRLRAAAPASAGDVRSDALAHSVLVARLPVFEWMLALAVYGIVDGQILGVAIGVLTVTAAWVGWPTLRGRMDEAGAGGRPGHRGRSDRRRGPVPAAGDGLPGDGDPDVGAVGASWAGW